MIAGPVCALTLLSNVHAQDVPADPTAPATPPPAPASSTPSMPISASGMKSPSRLEAERAAQEESRKRVEIQTDAMRDFQAGKAFELNGQIVEARARYVSAQEKLKAVGVETPLYRDVVDHLSAINWALINKGANLGARDAVLALINENLSYNPPPHERSRLEKLKASIESAKKTGIDKDLLTNVGWNPAFAKKVEDVQVWFVEIEQYWRTGQYDEAEKRCTLILSRDKYNKAAMDWQSRIIKKKLETAKLQQLLNREQRLNDVTEAQVNTYSPNLGMASLIPQEEGMTQKPTAQVASRLRDIRLPSVNFSGNTIRQVADTLSSLSRQFDPEKRGITFAVRPEAERGAQLVTLNMTNVPMETVLRYATQLAGVKSRVEDVGVFIVPASADDSVLLRRAFNVSPAFFTTPPATEPTRNPGAPAPRPRPTGPRGTGTTANEIREVLESKGIFFPPGASAVYYPDSGILSVVNSQDQLDYMEALFEGGERALMVDVSCKVVEIGQEDLNDLTFNYGFNLIPGAPSFNPFDPGTSFNPAVSSTSTALRGSQGLNNSGLDTLLSGVLVPNPNSIKISAQITTAEFAAVITALSQKKSFDMLSMPHVRVKSGEDARLNAIRTFRFPIEFDPPESVEASDNAGDEDSDSTLRAVGPPTVIPTFPRTFQAQDIGVKLAAKPQIAADSTNIDLSLVPELVDFDGFINYGDPIFVVNLENEQLLMSNNRIPQPVFSRRTIATKVTVKDGSTVVMGGLLREDVQTINDRVPFLGDLPLVGRLFQSRASKSTKRNLLIFTTCTIYLNNGERLNPTLR
ncbi:hypothetical protein DB346_11125 [Verrucomicrobia bacterium LW23]|nr:hypothetical protein DB346_11125 [Verrucomicrobia bacterium LW23]